MRKICILLTVCLCFSLVLPLSAADNTLYLVALGDSITTGYEMTGGRYGCKNYVNLLVQEMGWSRANYENYAVNGYTVPDMLDLLPSYRTQISQAKILVFDIGYNDILNAIFLEMVNTVPTDVYYIEDLVTGWAAMSEAEQTAAEKKLLQTADGAKFTEIYENFRTGLVETLKLLREYNPTASIFMQSIYNPLNAMEAMNGFSEAVIQRMNAVLQSCAKEYNCGFFDVYGAFHGRELEYTYMADYNIHPNEAGHEAIFRLFSATLKEAGITSVTFPETSPVTSETVAETVTATEETARKKSALPWIAVIVAGGIAGFFVATKKKS